MITGLRKIRIAVFKMEQKDFSKLLGVDQSTVSAWESGTRKPSTKMVLRISDKLKMPVGEIFDAFFK